MLKLEMSTLLLRQTGKAAVLLSTRQPLNQVATLLPPSIIYVTHRMLGQQVFVATNSSTPKLPLSALGNDNHLHHAVAQISPIVAAVNILKPDRWGAEKSNVYPSLQSLQPSTSEDACKMTDGGILENRAILDLITTEFARQRALVEVGEMLCMVSLSVFRALRKQLSDPHSRKWTDKNIVSRKAIEQKLDMVITLLLNSSKQS